MFRSLSCGPPIAARPPGQPCWAPPVRCSSRWVMRRPGSARSSPGRAPASAASTTTSPARPTCTWRCSRSSTRGRPGGGATRPGAREGCVSEPRQLFLAAARAYLDGCLEDRELSRLFVSGDAPPGFDLIMRQRLREWASRNADFFARSAEPIDEAVAVVMTGALMLAVAEVSLGEDAAYARRLADGVLDVLSGVGPRVPGVTSRLT